LTFCCVFLLMTVYAQSSELEDIVANIKSDRVSNIKKYFENTVPITINNIQLIYSRPQAEIVLKDFFSKNNPKDLVIESSGTPDNISKFAIGGFNTDNGKYNLYILLKLKSNNNYMLREIRINKE
jgi:hypothetical protein